MPTFHIAQQFNITFIILGWASNGCFQSRKKRQDEDLPDLNEVEAPVEVPSEFTEAEVSPFLDPLL